MHGYRTRIAAALSALAVLLCACSSPPAPQDPNPTITVASDGRVVSQVLAHLYAGALQAAGARTSLAPAAADPAAAVEQIATGRADFYAGFTGELLDSFDRSAAATTADEVYSALGRALPSWLTITDRTLAHRPASPGSAAAVSIERAQFVVPLLRSNPLARRLDDALGVVAGELTTADLMSMVRRVDAGESADRVTGDWLAGRPL